MASLPPNADTRPKVTTTGGVHGFTVAGVGISFSIQALAIFQVTMHGDSRYAEKFRCFVIAHASEKDQLDNFGFSPIELREPIE